MAVLKPAKVTVEYSFKIISETSFSCVLGYLSLLVLILLCSFFPPSYL